MSNLDELLNKTFNKEIKAKTLLVSAEELEKVKAEYLFKGWELVKESPLNGRYKVTFRKVK